MHNLNKQHEPFYCGNVDGVVGWELSRFVPPLYCIQVGMRFLKENGVDMLSSGNTFIFLPPSFSTFSISLSLSLLPSAFCLPSVNNFHVKKLVNPSAAAKATIQVIAWPTGNCQRSTTTDAALPTRHGHISIPHEASSSQPSLSSGKSSKPLYCTTAVVLAYFTVKYQHVNRPFSIRVACSGELCQHANFALSIMQLFFSLYNYNISTWHRRIVQVSIWNSQRCCKTGIIDKVKRFGCFRIHWCTYEFVIRDVYKQKEE